MHCLERVVDTLAHKVGKDPATLREENFIPKEAFPYHSPLGWEYNSGDYQAAMDKAKEMTGYDDLRREQAEKRERGELMGIGVCSFTEVLGDGGGDAGVGDRAYGDAVAASSAGGEGGGGVGYGGGTACDREHGGGRAGAPGGDAHGYSDSAGSGLGGVAEEGGGGVISGRTQCVD